jgi:hypothetical protein
LEFPLSQIAEMLAKSGDEADILDVLERQRDALEAKAQQYRNIVLSLGTVIKNEKEARIAMQNSTFEVEEKVLDTLLIAGVRMKGKYSDAPKVLGKIG